MSDHAATALLPAKHRNASRSPADVARLREQMLLLKDWYHNIDLGDGLVTPGRSYHYLWRMNRRLMDQVDFRGKSVLEIGACDGMFSFEAERRGAAYVVATDLMPYALDRFQFCKAALGSGVVPFYSTSIYELADWLPRLLSGLPSNFPGPRDRFDIVICFGVLYHLRDPMLGLAQIRSAVSDEGVVLFETATRRSLRPLMEFNSDGRGLYPDVTTWWVPSLSCLRAMCRGSLLEIVPGSTPWLYNLSRFYRRVRRIGFLARPLRADQYPHDYRYSIQTHYPWSVPRLK